MSDYKHDIERYLGGLMTPEERHAFEKRALSDPFLAEALEGVEQLSSHEFSDDVHELNKKIQEHQQGETLVAAASAPSRKMAKEALLPGSESKPVTRWTWGRIAAAIVILITSTYLILQFIPWGKDASPIVMNKSINSPQSSVSEDTLESKSPVTEDQNENTGLPETYKQEPAVAKESPLAKSTQADESSKEIPRTESKSQLAEQPVTTGIKKEEAIVQAEEIPVEREDRELIEAQRKKALEKDALKKSDAPAAGATIAHYPIIRGKVSSKDDGSPLPGINIVIKGTNLGTITDANGNYEISTTINNPTLVYSFIGFQTLEVLADNTREVNVQMQMDAAQLSEVVVTGYAPTSGRNEYAPVVELAHPENGTKSFKQYLEQQVQYPEEAKQARTEGRVTVEFYVETDGSLTGFKVIRGVGGGCDEELIRLIKTGPKWLPTKRDGVIIRDRVRVAYRFTLPKNE
jgi:TonB family protein